MNEGWQAVESRHEQFGMDVDKLIADIRHALPAGQWAPAWRALAGLHSPACHQEAPPGGTNSATKLG